MPQFTLPVRVYIEDTDAGGIVYYVNYLKFMERARTEFLRTQGTDSAAILNTGELLVVHSLSADYKRSAKLDDHLVVTVTVHELGKSFVEFEQKVLLSDELLCQGRVKIACVKDSARGLKPCPFPNSLASALANFV